MNESQPFGAIADAIVHIVYTHAPDGSIDWANRRWYDFTRLPPELALTPDGWRQISPPEDQARLQAAIERAFATATPYEIEIRFKPCGAPESELRRHLLRAVPMFDEAGQLVRWAGTATDVHDSYVADEERRREVTALAEAVPQIVWSADPTARLTFLNTRFEEFTGISSAQALEHGWQEAVPAADRALITQHFAAATHARRPMNFEHRLWHAPTRTYRSVLVRANPSLDANGEVTRWVGTLTDIDDDRRAHDRAHTVSEAFQRASLPRSLPEIPGLRFCAEYFAAGAEALVGGDWYDAFQLTDGRVVVSVGDVMGSGLDSAVTMAAARQAIRGAAQIYPDPQAVLDAADRALSSEQPERIVTAFVGVFEPVTGVFEYASAGHPGPLLRHPDGTLAELSDGGLPLGLRSLTAVIREPTRSTTIAPNALLVLYTDGLTEATRNTALGEARVRAAVSFADIDAAENIAQFIRRSVLATQPADDVAILTMSCSERTTSEYTRWTLSTRDAEASVRLRRDIVALIGAASESESADAEVIVGELLGNVVRHTQGDVEVVLDRAGEYPILHVLDRGAGFTYIARLPQDVLSENGRGCSSHRCSRGI